jgi:hypothetical protein
MRHLLLIILFLGGCWLNSATAQEDSTKTKPDKMLVIKNDGVKYVGYILEDDGREILMETESVGKIYIPKLLIKSISKYTPEEIKEDVKPDPNEWPEHEEKEKEEMSYEEWRGNRWRDRFFQDEEEYEFKNYTSTKYIQTDNAYPLRKGEAFVKFMPVGLEAQIPVTKNWSVGAVSTYLGAPFALKSKLSFPLADSSFLALDINYGTMAFGGIMDVDERNGGGYASLTYTFGDRQRNFSVRMGYAMVHQYWEEWDWDEINGTPTFLGGDMEYNNFVFGGAAAMVDLNPRLSVIFDVIAAYGNVQSWGENFNTFAAAAGVAARFGPNPRHRFQLGGTLFSYDGFFIPVPVPNISYTYVFRKRNP